MSPHFCHWRIDIQVLHELIYRFRLRVKQQAEIFKASNHAVSVDFIGKLKHYCHQRLELKDLILDHVFQKIISDSFLLKNFGVVIESD
jgi:hypothetical protein